MKKSTEKLFPDKSLEFDKTKQIKTERQLDKMRPINDAPFFEASDDSRAEDFVNANDPEKKYIPIEEVADSESDFTEQENAEDEELEDEELEDEVGEEDSLEKDELEETRKSFGEYEYIQTGSKYGNLESFHVDHDREELLAVGREIEEEAEVSKTVKGEDMDLKFADLDKGAATHESIYLPNYSNRKIGWTGKKNENLKTRDDSERAREHRGLIRRFLDKIN
jgi:hypothetical protein